MLIETKDVKQSKEDVQHRWFSDDYFDLILWQNQNKDILRFELCYDKNKNEHAYVWNQQSGYTHLKVDDGEGVLGRYKMSPIFIADGYFDRENIAAKFLEAGKNIDGNIAKFVYEKLKEYNKNPEKP